MSALQPVSALPVAEQAHASTIGMEGGAVKLIPSPIMVRSFTPVALAASANTVATLVLPANYMAVPKQFHLHYAVYAASNTSWTVELALDGTVLSNATFTGIATFDRHLYVVADVANNKLWCVRVTDGRAAVTDAVTFTGWTSPATCTLKITPSIPATLVTCAVTETR